MPQLVLGQPIQIGIIVPDLDAAVAAWSALLGSGPADVQTTAELEQAHPEYRGAPTRARARLAFFPLGQVTLELIQPLDGPSTWADQLRDHGPSLHHVAFEVKGMAEHVAALEAAGIPLVQRGEYTGGRYAYLYAVAKLGATVELLEND